MKRLTLQDLRSFVYKKGRLLYGAVFLFCLVLFYGLYVRNQERAQVSNNQVQVSNNHGQMSKNYGQMSNNQGQTSVKGNQKQRQVNNELKESFDGPRSADGEAPKGQKVISLNPSLRALPFENPFYRNIQNKIADRSYATETANGASTVYTSKTALPKGSSESSGHAGSNDVAFNNISSHNTEFNNSSSSNFSSNHSPSRYTNSNTVPEIHRTKELTLVGIIEGQDALAILNYSQGEGVYAVGEGPPGIVIQYIGHTYVDVVIQGSPRRLYML